MRGEGKVGGTIVKHRPSELCISSITLAELRFGADRRRSSKLHALIDSFTSNIAVLPFDEDCAANFGTVAAHLAERGTPIGELNVLIGTHALTASAVLVTNNTKHFARVARLRVENWY